MSKSVNIDGNDYIIENCDSCPFYDDGDSGYGCHCQYPKSPSVIVRTDFNSWEKIAEDCPLKESRDQNELKSCPFCGGQPMLATDNDKKQCCMSRFRIVCKECGAGTRWYVNTDEAWISWKGRVKE